MKKPLSLSHTHSLLVIDLRQLHHDFMLIGGMDKTLAFSAVLVPLSLSFSHYYSSEHLMRFCIIFDIA